MHGLQRLCFVRGPSHSPGTGIWLVLCSWRMEAATEAMACVVCSDTSSKLRGVNDLTTELVGRLPHIHLRG
jgi:hypothetical protein